MLMMTTIFMTVMAELPSTAYVKQVDLWLIVCQLVTFLEVLLLITIEALREKKDDDEEVSETVAAAADVDATATAAVPASAVTLKLGEVVTAPKLPKAMTGGQQESQTLGKPKTKQFVNIFQLLEISDM
jgi:hypothetical protein